MLYPTPVPQTPALVTLETCIGIKSGLCIGRTDGLHRGVVGVFQKEEVLCAASSRGRQRVHLKFTPQFNAVQLWVHAYMQRAQNASRQHAMAHVRSHLVDSPAAHHACLLLPPLAAPYMLWRQSTALPGWSRRTGLHISVQDPMCMALRQGPEHGAHVARNLHSKRSVRCGTM